MNHHPTTKTNQEYQPIRPDADLGLAMLVAEDEEGGYEPVAIASTLSEAYELAASDMALRMNQLNQGNDPGLCPARYALWVRGQRGEYANPIEIIVGQPKR